MEGERSLSPLRQEMMKAFLSHSAYGLILMLKFAYSCHFCYGGLLHFDFG